MSGAQPRVAHVVPALFGRTGIVGGGERYAFELARHMARRTPTRLVTFGDRDERYTADELDVRVIGSPHFVRGQRTNPVSLRLITQLTGSDVIHCHQTHTASASFSALLARVTGRRVFTTELGGGGWDVSSYISTDGWFHGHLHISEYSRRISGHEQLASATVILGGVDTDLFAPDPSVRRDGGVLFAGRVLPHKGLDDLIDAAAAGLPVDIVGPTPDGAYADALRSRAVGTSVRFLGAVSDEELVGLYRRARCVVLPSVYRTNEGKETRVPELLGQTLLEGMACGAPAVCTNVASLPEIVDHGVTGFIVPPNAPEQLGAALRQIADDPERARAIGQQARQTVLDRFTWPQVVSRCLAAYTAPSQ